MLLLCINSIKFLHFVAGYADVSLAAERGTGRYPLRGRLYGLGRGTDRGDTPWADWGNAAVNESLTATKTAGVWASCLSPRKRWISPPLKPPLKRPSRVCLPGQSPSPARRVWLWQILQYLNFSLCMACQCLIPGDHHLIHCILLPTGPDTSRAASHKMRFCI